MLEICTKIYCVDQQQKYLYDDHILTKKAFTFT